MAGCSKDELEYIINHVVLPPRLPQQAEVDEFVAKVEEAFLSEVLSVLQAFLQQSTAQFKAPWSIVQRMLSCCVTAKLLGDLSEKLLTEAMLTMEPGDAFPARIRAQNAAIIFRRTEDVISLECFEMSPQSGDVIGCKGSLQRLFPAYAVAISHEVATDRKFCRELFNTLKRLDLEVVHEMMPKSKKASEDWSEFRDTCHPGLVSEMIMAVVAAIGSPIKTFQIQKRIRDDVIWDRSLLPWRRSTLWLTLRVAIHTTLARSMEPSEAHVQYKNFVIYFLARLLNRTADLDVAIDVCKVLQMKIARRGAKLAASILPFVQEAARAHMEEAAKRQDIVWQELLEKDAKRQAEIDVRTLEQDTCLTLLNSRAALDTALREVEHGAKWRVTIPTDHRQWITFKSDGLPYVNGAIESRPEKIYALSEYEHWIDQSLSGWLETALLQPSAMHCTSIFESAEGYKRLALDLYSASPERLSVMLLSIGDLWYALDSIAGSLIPLLHIYSPEIRSSIFDVLLLPKLAQMQRLQRLQSHIKARHQDSQFSASPIVADSPGKGQDCFAYKYFDQSADHRILRQAILAEAKTRSEEKQREWQRKTDQHNALTREMNSLSCSDTVNYYGDTVHDANCRKCDLKRQIGSLVITVFEWPLPENETQSRLAVFNLRCPEAFAAWQNLTWVLVHDLGRGSDVGGAAPAGHLSTYTGLTPYYEDSTSRLVLAATTKSVTVSHYRETRFPIDSEKVFSRHGLHYKLYDRDRRCWVNEQTETPSFSFKCRIVLPEGPHKNLQYAVDSTSHPQNHVLAAQTECSPDLSIHEYVAFGSLRADGEKTQWFNICRELRASSLSWNTESVCSLIKQAAWQGGSPGTTAWRTTHIVFESIEFTTELLSNLEMLLESIQANRQSYYAMEVLIILAQRTLSLTPDYNCIDRCLKILGRCRSVASTWAYEMEHALRLATNPDEIAIIRRSLLRSALLCKLTFDVDTCYSPRVLSTSDDLLYWTSASMIIHDNTPGTDSELPLSVRLALLYDTYLSHSNHRQLHQLLNDTNNTGLDRAISRIWSTFRSVDDVWGRLMEGAIRWIYKQTLGGFEAEPQQVSYNVLSGELLVDGRPLGSLPKDYTSHRVFIRLFGAQILRISTSDMAGMQYMTAAEEYGYRFYFDLRGADLIIRAKTTSTVLELISHERFFNDLPTMFVEDFTHWLDLTTGVVEFRPLTRRWTADVSNWRLTYQAHGVSHLQNNQQRLIDVRSRTCHLTLDVFGKLETLMFTHITRSTMGRFHVFLPRLGFHFTRKDDGELECQELRKIVDPNQSLGTIIGLQSRLVLCAQGDRSKKLDRLVLVPEGAISTETEGPHLKVHITTAGRNVHCFRYRYDPILKRLDGDSSVVSRLYQAYLHALTSFILPDPLTGYLGMEQSVRILQEQIFRCCKPLNSAEIDILNLIASLTPHRVFYPTHRKVMQQVTWREGINPLVQHGVFSDIVRKIVTHSEQFHKFYQDLESLPALKSRGDEHLLQRAKVRHSTYLNIDFGGGECTAKYDKEYGARDLDRDQEKVARVYSISSFVSSWTGNMIVTSDLAPIWRSWGVVAGFGSAFDFSLSVADLLNLDLALSWGSLYYYSRTSSRGASLYKLLFLFAQISYGSRPLPPNDLKTVLAFATNQSLRSLPDFPSHNSFQLSSGSVLDSSNLRTAIRACIKPFEVSRAHLPASQRREEHAEYQRRLSANVESASVFYENQWPCRQPTHIPESSVKWLEIKAITRAVNGLFAEWYKNRECEQHLAMIGGVISSTMTLSIEFPFDQSTWHQAVIMPRVDCVEAPRTISNLMHTSSPNVPGLPSVIGEKYPTKMLEKNPKLRSLVSDFGGKSDEKGRHLKTCYKMDLLASFDALQEHEETIWPHEIPRASSTKVLLCHLQPKELSHQLLEIAGLWPRLRIRDLLALIATTSCISIPQEWVESIVAIGVGVTALQRTRRLVLAAEKCDTLSFFREMENTGHSGWDARGRPDWLLTEIENDLLIRPVQVRLNMGEGKSSVIIPLIAATLADTSRLVRVVVLRSLTRQMQDTLTQKLGGLVNRPVYFMPFSRKTSLDETVVGQMQSMFADCMNKGGVIIAQPEHILSFKLVGIERVASEHLRLGAELVKTQTWLDENCRDILDESDEILDVKFQLLYTLGGQRNMDGQPDRWLMMQGIFDIVQNQALLLQAQYPEKIEVEKRASGSFPRIRLPSTDVRNLLISRVSADICQSKLAGLVVSTLPPDVSRVVAYFIARHDVTVADCKIIQSYFINDEAYLKKLLFARGLIACGILLHVLHDKRWSVTYGLHPTRCLCAVPYRAKGVPAATAEFGHPDVALALTCLSYYYTGLTNDQLRASLEILHKADDPSLEYGTWTIEDPSFPKPLRYWNAINLEDHRQCNEILFPALRFNKKVADFFMTNVVFPKEGKEFDQKLSTSGWDIPARPCSKQITTGFSGTNDNRFLLPSSISQRDLPELQHTSGKVLEFLSRPENLSYTCAKDSKGCQLSSPGLLDCIMRVNSSVRVLIDVGAQILDLSNDEVIARWLVLEPNADAGVFFSADDHAMVLTRDGKTEALTTSSFVNRMDRCVVYLDDVHTRDLNGWNVIEWALGQSWQQIERNQPLHVLQGLNYHRREEALDGLKQRLLPPEHEGATSADVLGNEIVEREAQSLHDLYAPDAMRDYGASNLVKKSRSNPDPGVQELMKLWDQIDPRASRNANMHEELEREVGHEVEQEIQIERPPRATPEERKVDPRLLAFISTGTLSSALSCSSAYLTVLQRSSTSRLLVGQSIPWQGLRVSSDFVKTVKGSTTSANDDYLRPVHWLLVCKDATVRGVALIVSQYEVNQCLDRIQAASSRVTLISYEPRVTRSMVSLDALQTHSLPGAKEAWNTLDDTLRQELHLFAGQLYFTSFEEYEVLVKSLASEHAAPLGFIREWIGIRRKGQNFLATHIGQVASGRVLHQEMFESADEDTIMTDDE
ncbi:MAG: hypothetical protein Q9178_002128 [Gyalolechia marmorata]